MNQTRVALVTGVSSGIGKAIAQSLARHGFRVFGTMRSEHNEGPKQVEIVQIGAANYARGQWTR